MTVPSITLVRSGTPGRPRLVLGPSLGTSARALWGAVAERLGAEFDVIAWDLPGHGANTAATEPFSLAELAEGVLSALDSLPGDGPTGGFAYAGVSVGGAVGFHLLLDSPERVQSAVLLCTGATIGDPDGWRERAATVRASGTPSLVDTAAARWFAPDFLSHDPATGSALLESLVDAEDEGYAAVCEALAEFDVRRRLAEIETPVLAIAGADDIVTPPAALREIASGVRRGRLVELPGTAHLAPAERPVEVAGLIAAHASAVPGADPYAAGMAVRRSVLGGSHVDRATAATTDVTRDFQELITRYAWGSIWTRPGLDRRSRSMITLTALIAHGHHEELAMHVRAARTNGLTDQEITEVLLQSAIYCGVPAANTAFRIAQRVLAEFDEDG